MHALVTGENGRYLPGYLLALTRTACADFQLRSYAASGSTPGRGGHQ
jgi:hypothetical protein